MPNRGFAIFLALLFSLLLSVGPCPAADSTENLGLLVIHGKVQDADGRPVDEVAAELLLDGKPFEPVVAGQSAHRASAEVKTGKAGLYEVRVRAPLQQVRTATWSVSFHKPNYRGADSVPVRTIIAEATDTHANPQFEARVDASLHRHQDPGFWIALLVLVGIYVLISLELVHRTLAAMLGAVAILAVTHTVGHFHEGFRILTFEQSLRAVDWNVVFLLMGMMIMVGVLKESGVFQWMAYKSFQITGGRVFLLVAVLCVVTAVLSAFLDNVTTMLLLTPVSIELAIVLGISPFALLLPEIMASNFGGTATLIGDPPNIMIGSFAGLTFNDFLITLTPVVLVTMAAQIWYTRWYYGKDYHAAKVQDVPKLIGQLREEYRITNMRILIIGGTVLLGVILLFVMHGFFHMEVSVAALLGAALVLLLNRSDLVRVLEHDVEWTSLLFFIMLFVVVGAAEETGILHLVADAIKRFCGGNLVPAIVLVVWTSAILSAIVDNIPFTATMLPVVALLTRTIPGGESGVLWWALALGACFGGNGTIIGASANVITVGMAERSGHHITFVEFLKHGAPITFASLVIATVWLIVFLR